MSPAFRRVNIVPHNHREQFHKQHQQKYGNESDVPDFKPGQTGTDNFGFEKSWPGATNFCYYDFMEG
jgi:hypothetical protein